MTYWELLASIPDAGEGHQINFAFGSWWRPYQSLPLPDGSEIPGLRSHDARIGELGLREVIRPGDSVLDVGCSLGAICLAAWKLGAWPVLGVDINPSNIECARRLASVHRAQYSLRCCSCYDVVDGAEYDVTLCLSMIENVAEPGVFLARLAQATKKVLVFEGHKADTPAIVDQYRAWLSPHFAEVELIGFGEAGANAPSHMTGQRRPIFHARRYG
jgi:ubiquinone/menaquinone biosynthesis C-methylase UbiE